MLMFRSGFHFYKVHFCIYSYTTLNKRNSTFYLGKDGMVLGLVMRFKMDRGKMECQVVLIILKQEDMVIEQISLLIKLDMNRQNANRTNELVAKYVGLK